MNYPGKHWIRSASFSNGVDPGLNCTYYTALKDGYRCDFGNPMATVELRFD